MGCCSSSQQGRPGPPATPKRAVYVTYNGKRNDLESPPKDLKAFRERMYQIDPVLRWRAWHPQAQLEQPLDIYSPETYSEYVTKLGAQRFIITIVMAKRADLPDYLRKYQGAVAMLLDKERNVIGNAVLITRNHVIVSDRLIMRREDLPNFWVYFQLDKDVILRFKQQGTFVHPEELEVVVAELDLEDPQADPVTKLTPVTVESVAPPTRKEPMDFLYNSTTSPTLHLQPDVHIVANEDRFYITDKGPERALGAPLFHKNSKLAGVMLESKNKQKRVLIITELLGHWRSQPLAPEVKEVIIGMGVSLEEEGNRYQDDGDVVALPASYNRVKVEAAGDPAAIEVDVVNFDDPKPSFQTSIYTSRAFTIRSKGNASAVYYHGKDDYKLISKTEGVELQPGFTLTATPEGLLLAGGAGSALQSAYFWTEPRMTPLPDLPVKHSGHCGVYLDGVVYLVSGEFTTTTSAFTVSSRSWNTVAPLTERRWQAGICASNGSLYVAGGLVNGGPSSDVLQYEVRSNQWKVTGVRLEAAVCCVGLSILEQGRLLVMGGLVNRSPSGDTYVKDLTSGALVSHGKLPIPASFREFSASLDPDFLIFDSEGHLFQLDSAKQQVLLLSLPPVS